jgi:hypothetical protein
VEQYRGEVVKDPGAIKPALDLKGIYSAAAMAEEKQVAIKSTKETNLTVAMLAITDKFRYGKLTEDLENAFTKGRNNYPTNITVPYTLIPVNNVFGWLQMPL